jgi:hypothetical protein
MNKSLLFYLLIATGSIPAIAQDKNNAQENKWSIGVQLSTFDRMTPLMNLNVGIDNMYMDGGDRKNKSFSIGMMLIKHIKKNINTRIKIGVTNNHFLEHRDLITGLGGHMINDMDFKQKIMNFSPGISCSLAENNIIFYGGFEMPVLIYNKLISYSSFMQKDSTGIVSEQSYSNATAGGGFGIGPGVFMGFNIQANDRLLIGSEFSCAFLYRKVGGNITATDTELIPFNSTTVTKYHQTIQDFGIPRIIGSITVSYSF